MSDLHCPARLFLARHGEAEYETDVLTDAGGCLTLRGRDQARALARSLAGERIARIYCSGLARAVQTAEIAAAELGVSVRVRDNLHEWLVGDFDGRPYVEGMYDEVLRAWAQGDVDARIPGGESAREICARVAGELETIVDEHRGEAVLVVGHGGALRVSVPQLAVNLPGGYGADHDLEHCDVVSIEVDADGWAVQSWGGEPVEQTASVT
ncbi:MAG TPA: histidine phosphatase family protein [Nocardioidaceae bacterium]|nr:histidine phosphatase family protein [Nocardioidaceae bacterium]